MKIWELGEFGLIDKIAQLVGSPKGNVVLGIGDDVAIWRVGPSLQLATTDSLVEGVHFLSGQITWRELGWKGLAVNISDIASMGGNPRYALVTFGLPEDMEVEDVISIYEGILEIAEIYDVAVIGGDLVSSPQIIISITVLGDLEGEVFLSRSSARPGDKIGITGYLGSSAGGLEMIKRGLNLEKEIASFLRQAHFRPLPRVNEGKILLRYGVKTAIDISDGLISDLGHICRMSKVGAKVRIDKIPIHPYLKEVFKEEALEFALSGGEDYELLFTAPQKVIAELQRELPFTIIGEIIEGRGIELLDEKGRPFLWQKKGWDHFAPHNS